MQIVIDISKEIYQEAIKSGYSHLYDEEVANAVANGTPLPKGHGDLISKAEVLHVIDERIEQIKRDADAIKKSYSHLSFAEGVHDGYCRLKCDIRVLPTIIEADKAESEE